MGFFDSSSTQDSTVKYDNPELRQYTQAYRDAAPWGFASLDPSATLAAMGKGTLGLSKKFKESLQGMSDTEKKQAQASQDAMQRIADRQKSGNFLTSQETDFINQNLDKAFEASRTFAYRDWEKGAQTLAGSLGLRTSDTPVAAPAMQSLRDMELGFSSQRAQTGLNATMQMSAQQNQFDEGLMNSLNSLQFNRWNARQGFLFGGGMQAASQLGYTTNTHSKTTQGMSGFGQVMASLDMANKFMSTAQNLGGPLMSMGSMGGGSAPGGGGYGGGMGLSGGDVGHMFG